MPTAKANSRGCEQMDGFRQSGSPRDQNKTAALVTVRYDTGVSMHLIDPMVDSFPSRSAPSAGHILFWHRLDKSHLASREKQQALLKPPPSRHVRSRHETVRQSRPCDGIMEPPDKLQDSTTHSTCCTPHCGESKPTTKANSRRYEQMDGFRQSGSPRDQTKTAA